MKSKSSKSHQPYFTQSIQAKVISDCKARSTLRLSEAQKLVCFIKMELCAAHDLCSAQPRTAEKKFTLLFNSSQPAATAICRDREFSIFQVQV